MSEATARDQLMLELINRARLAPAAEAKRLGIDLNQGLAPGTISTAPKQVLAFNPLLNDAAVAHSSWELSNNIFSYFGAGGTNYIQRIQNAGYELASPFDAGTSQAYGTGTMALDSAIPDFHDLFFTNASAQQRLYMLDPDFKEFGMGSAIGLANLNGFVSTNTLILTEYFGFSGTAVFVTGVHYNDSDGNHFYSIGEGIGQRTASLLQNGAVVGSAVSGAAGGYAISASAQGVVELQFSGGDLNGVIGVSFTLGASNVKADLVDGVVMTNVSAQLTQGAGDLQLIGIERISGTGNGLANAITGNGNANTLKGLGGNDRLSGGGGNDTLSGGSGDDSLSGGAGNDTLNGNAGADVLRGGSGADIFVFSKASDIPATGARDVIADFVSGSDRIDLSGLGATMHLTDGTGLSGFSGAGAAAEGEVRFVQTTGNQTMVDCDLNGDGLRDVRIVLSGLISLAPGDFIL